MAVCARGSVLVFYAVFAVFSTFFFLGGGGIKNRGRAVFQGPARMITI